MGPRESTGRRARWWLRWVAATALGGGVGAALGFAVAYQLGLATLGLAALGGFVGGPAVMGLCIALAQVPVLPAPARQRWRAWAGVTVAGWAAGGPLGYVTLVALVEPFLLALGWTSSRAPGWGKAVLITWLALGLVSGVVVGTLQADLLSVAGRQRALWVLAAGVAGGLGWLVLSPIGDQSWWPISTASFSVGAAAGGVMGGITGLAMLVLRREAPAGSPPAG